MVPIAFFDLAGNLLQMANVFPADLVVTGDQQGLRINQELPYVISMADTKDKLAADELPSNILTFTSDEAIKGIPAVRELDSLFVLTPTTAYIASDEGDQEIRVYPIPEFEESFMLDRSTIDTFLTRVLEHPILKQKLYIPALLVISLIIIYPVMLIFRAFTLVIYASITWIIVSLFMKSKNLSWSKVFQISLHSITPIVLIDYGFSLTMATFFHGWFYFIAFLIWTLVVISRLKINNSVVASQMASRSVSENKVSKSKKSGFKKR